MRDDLDDEAKKEIYTTSGGKRVPVSSMSLAKIKRLAKVYRDRHSSAPWRAIGAIIERGIDLASKEKK